jgi:hypothetical protein
MISLNGKALTKSDFTQCIDPLPASVTSSQNACYNTRETNDWQTTYYATGASAQALEIIDPSHTTNTV